MSKGFTLIELIVVIAIIAILAAIIAPNAFKAIEKAKVSKTIVDMKAIRSAALGYVADTGQWPWQGAVHHSMTKTGQEGFLADDGASGWDGPYLEGWPVSQWKEKGLEFWYIHYLADWDSNGIAESHLISLRSSLGGAQGSNGLPTGIMLKIDTILDDGDLNTGKIRKLNQAENWFDYCLVY